MRAFRYRHSSASVRVRSIKEGKETKRYVHTLDSFNKQFDDFAVELEELAISLVFSRLLSFILSPSYFRRLCVCVFFLHRGKTLFAAGAVSKRER